MTTKWFFSFLMGRRSKHKIHSAAAVVNTITVAAVFFLLFVQRNYGVHLKPPYFSGLSSNRKRWGANGSKWVQKKTLTPKIRYFSPFSRQISLPYSSNRKRHFSESADTALFSRHKNAPLFCIKIRVHICQRTLILIQFVLRFLLLVAFSFGHSSFLLSLQ